LYNSLNYMYSQAQPISKNLAKSILILSDMMRYSIAKTDDSGFSFLEKEIQYLENFIEIHRLRFTNNFFVNFEVSGIIGSKKIAPLILITFIENAIKHGIISEKNKPVDITLEIENMELTLKVDNHKQVGRKDETSGIGLDNTRKRLHFLYPKKHTLYIKENKNTFLVNLKIELND
jgi:two-component system, LytTR family, sensor kinase